MTASKIELTKDPLTNIHIMAPLLDKEGCKTACTFIFGLMVGAENSNNSKMKLDKDDPQNAG